MFKFDRQKIILIVTKYLAYTLNAVIVCAVVYGVFMWVMLLIESASM